MGYGLHGEVFGSDEGDELELLALGDLAGGKLLFEEELGLGGEAAAAGAFGELGGEVGAVGRLEEGLHG